MTGADRLLTVDEVADWLAVPAATLRTWRKHPHRSGDPPLPVVKVGGHLRYRRADVETWLQANTITARPRAVRRRVS